MVLTKIDENNFPITSTPLQKALSKRLEEGKVRIFYRINKGMDEINYLGADDYFGTFPLRSVMTERPKSVKILPYLSFMVRKNIKI